MSRSRGLGGLSAPEVGLSGVSGFSGVGEAVFPTPGTFSWTVPDGVSEIFICCIGGGGGGHAGYSSYNETDGGDTSVLRGATALCSAYGGAGGLRSYTITTKSPSGTDGAGVKDGGSPGSPPSNYLGGGAGGYLGAGTGGVLGASASRGGKSGGGSNLDGQNNSPVQGVDAAGAGTGGRLGGQNSADHISPTPGYAATTGADYGGGGSGFDGGGGGEGGELSYRNFVAVTPGEVLTVTVGSPGWAGGWYISSGTQNNGATHGGRGGVAIFWGSCGEFPLLAGVPKP